MEPTTTRAPVLAFRRTIRTGLRLAAPPAQCLFWATLLIAGQGAAQVHTTGPLGDARGIGFDSALREAREHPLINALREGAEAQAAAASNLPAMADNPSLNVMPGWRTHPAGDEGPEVQVTYNQPVRLTSVIGPRRAAARAAEAQANAQIRMESMGRAQQAAGLWLALWERREALALVVESQRLSEEFVMSTRRAAELGQLTRADVAHAEVFLGQLEVERLRVAGEVHEFGLALALHLGRPVDQPVHALGEPPSVDLPSTADLMQRTRELPSAPVVQLAQAAAAVAQVQVERARAENTPNMGIGFYFQRESPGGFMAYLNATFTLPFFEQGTLQRAAAQAQLSKAEAQRILAQRSAAYELSLLAHEVTHRRESEAAVRDRLYPPLGAQLAASERLFEVGEGSVLELLRARQAELSGRQDLVAAQAARLLAEQRLFILLHSYGLLTPDRKDTP